MATPQMRVEMFPRPTSAGRRGGTVRRRSALRLLEVERSEEIFPILLEELISLGCTRALVLDADFETGELHTGAAINCSKSYAGRLKTSLYATEDPIINVLHSMQPAVLPRAGMQGRSLYCHPVVFKNNTRCWEADRENRPDCLATANFRRTRKLSLQEQVCSVCQMRAYASLVVAELPARTDERLIADLRAHIELANKYLARLFKVEHYYNRMSDMEVVILQMERVMASMTDPVILTDSHHRVILQNRAAERFFKLPEDFSEGARRAVELNNLLFSATLSSMGISKTESSRDLTLVDAQEGEEMLFEAVCTPTFDREGRQTGMVTVMRDVTDLRRADEEVRSQYEKLRHAEEVVRQDRDRLNVIIENVGDPIVVCDNTGKIVLLDPLAQELFGIRKPLIEEGEAKPLETSRDPNIVRNQARFDAYIMAFTFSFSDKESGPLRLFQPSSGVEVEYDARSGKIYDTRGQTAYTVTVLRDLSPLRKVEQLKVERRMLEMEKFAATGRLAGTIAHEVNNPMEAIKNAIYLLQGGVVEEKQPVYDILKNETERVARIVRQMLGLYRNTEAVGSVDVNAVIEDTVLLFTRQLQRNRVETELDLGKVPPAIGSADQLRQVLSNLVVNARDSMTEGGRLRFRTRERGSSDGLHTWVRILIADTGTGISPEMLPLIFDPFVSTKGEKGTGLGLWIVKGIVENLGGKIRVRSKVGKGTVFKIDIPVMK